MWEKDEIRKKEKNERRKKIGEKKEEKNLKIERKMRIILTLRKRERLSKLPVIPEPTLLEKNDDHC